METVIRRKLSLDVMGKLFNRTDLIYIKHYTTKTNNIINEEDKVYFSINIRHSETDNVATVFKKALKLVS